MKINHKYLRSLKKNLAQPYPPCDIAAVQRGQTQLMLFKAPSRRCSLQCWTVFICYCKLAAMKICSYPYKTKEKEISSQTLLCFPLQFHCAYGISCQPSLIDMLSLFLLPWLGITPWRKLFLMEHTVQWHCSAQLQYHVQVTTPNELLCPEFIPVHSKRSVDVIGSPLEITDTDQAPIWHVPVKYFN